MGRPNPLCSPYLTYCHPTTTTTTSGPNGDEDLSSIVIPTSGNIYCEPYDLWIAICNERPYYICLSESECCEEGYFNFTPTQPCACVRVKSNNIELSRYGDYFGYKKYNTLSECESEIGKYIDPTLEFLPDDFFLNQYDCNEICCPIGDPTTTTLPPTTTTTTTTTSTTTTTAAPTTTTTTTTTAAPTAPGAPTNFSGISGNSQVSLSWAAPASNGNNAPLTYHIDWSSSNSGGSDFVDASTTSYTATGLINGTSYTFNVRAANSVNYSPYATPSVTVTPASIPNAPTDVSGTRGNGQVSLTWSGSYTGGSAIINHTIEYTPSGGSLATVVTGSANASYTVTGLINGTSYTFKVKATNSIGDSLYSASSTAVTPATTPDAPTNVVGTPGSTQVSLTWTAPASNGGSAITFYNIQWNSGSDYVLGATTSYTATGLTTGTSYTFRVRATNSSQGNPWGPYSDYSSAVTPT